MSVNSANINIIEIKDLIKTYMMGNVEVNAVNGINLEIQQGEFVVIAGPSGAGKTTLLNILGGMDRPTSGSVKIDGAEISGLNENKLTAYRRYDIGFVFQFYNLIQNLTAIENVELASQICKNPENPSDILEHVGLSHRLHNFPAQLSGGEQQRVSIARAIAKNPKLLLCDEPTGALDYNTGKQILALLSSICKQKNKTVIIITHNAAIAPMADRVVYIKNGVVETSKVNEKPQSVDEIEW